MKRTENLNQIYHDDFDVCVIGGGASGAGVALDAALRGYKVALIEKNDFSSATSGKSTKLIHGGVRYLEQAIKKLDLGQLKQVRHGLAERAYVLNNAPHLARPLSIITPVFSWLEGFYFSIGLQLYSFFAVNDSLPGSKWLSKKKTLLEMPTLSKKLHSSVQYFDGQFDDSRYAISLALSADRAGAAILNYAKLIGFNYDENSKIKSAIVQNLIAHKENDEVEQIEIKAKAFVNCTGPFSDSIRHTANKDLNARIRPSKGVHLILPKKYLPGSSAMLIPKTKDERLIFVIPFEDVVMVGTTDTPYNNFLKEPILEEDEVDYLLDTMDIFFEKKPEKSEVKAGFGGLRPLVAEESREGQDTKSLLRDHVIEYDEKSGLFSLMGGKWTTYRLMAQDMVDAIEYKIGKKGPCQTKKHVLYGGDNYDPNFGRVLAGKYKMPEDVCNHLNAKYGDQSELIIQIAQEKQGNQEKIHSKYPYIIAEIIYAVRHEQAVKLRDFFARRTRFEIQDWEDVIESVPKVASIMAEELAWSAKLQAEHEAEYIQKIQKFKERAGL